MITLYQILPVALLRRACTQPPSPIVEPQPAPEPESAEPANYVYLYARLHESQPKADAEAQYLENIQKALAEYQFTAEVEEIRGTEDTVEFIGIDMKIAVPESETEALETLLMDTFRLSGAPYATQIFIVTP